MAEKLSSEQREPGLDLASTPYIHILGIETGGRLELRYVRPGEQMIPPSDNPPNAEDVFKLSLFPEQRVEHHVTYNQLYGDFHQHNNIIGNNNIVGNNNTILHSG